MAKILWVACCDAYRCEPTRAISDAAAETFSAALKRNPGETKWISDRAVLAAVTGAFADAERDLAWLRKHEPGKVVATLRSVMRAWIPGFELNADGTVPPEGAAWWKRQVQQAVTDGLAGAQALRTLGEIWMGEIENAEAMLRRSAPPLLEAASFCILACCNGAPGVARRVWSSLAGTSSPASLGERLLVLVARVLCEPPTPDMLAQLRVLNAEAFSLYDRTWPSNPRCLYSALAHNQLGDRAGAAEWLRRAEAQNPHARALRQRLGID